MLPSSSLDEPLLAAKPTDPTPTTFGGIVLVTVVLLSSLGMMLLKAGQVLRSPPFLCMGYACEITAFLVYPIALQYFPMRMVTVLWSACSNVTAYLGGVYVFNECHNTQSLAGCLLTVAGVGVVATSLQSA